jgi:hypothetical protein
MDARKFEFKPSAFGFRSIIPKSRLERRGCKDKVLIEKSRIDQRVGWQAKQQRENAPSTSAGLTACPEGAAGYLSNSDRFHSDTAGEEFDQRKEKLRREKEAIAYRSRQTQEREDIRWAREDEVKSNEAAYWERVRSEGLKAKKNQSAVAYDITSMVYKQDESGAMQKHLDELVRYRARMRMHNLAVQADTRVEYNIINGGPRYIPPVPSRIDEPEMLDRSKRTMLSSDA